MRRMFKPILAMTALAVSGLALMAPVGPASAAVVSQVPIYFQIQGNVVELPVEEVAHRGGRRGGARRGGRRGGARRGGRRGRIHRGRHGHRYSRHRRRGYGHRYRGRWYANPWWIVGTGVAIGAASGGRCGWVSRQCTARWGYGGSNYWGCMRYDGCD